MYNSLPNPHRHAAGVASPIPGAVLNRRFRNYPNAMELWITTANQKDVQFAK
ncbi:hypothetical protein SGGMMB4_01827 [Sodalis glossinidius str. 'morsitans']|uniref:Uncharacterized protein n=1 Tax=Sodalis glossinidius (strain morsitans) TaxID=343509 RepID=A0A193QHH5_SODGM|nr:hypothetical protein SGGMMB4_01827 [Sodalis glossinidius str. 'morsitans']